MKPERDFTPDLLLYSLVATFFALLDVAADPIIPGAAFWASLADVLIL